MFVFAQALSKLLFRVCFVSKDRKQDSLLQAVCDNTHTVGEHSNYSGRYKVNLRPKYLSQMLFL